MSEPIYRDGFAESYDGKTGWAVVQRDFEMEEPEPDEVFFAEYDLSEPYEGSADVLYRRGDRFYYVSGSHCSCFGLEGQWEPEEYTAEQLAEQARRAKYGFFADRRELVLKAVA